MNHNSLNSRNYNIDLLRAMAIVLVLLFHFEIFNFTGGYIGVDIFFVISGYLITKIILKKKNILEFYYNRVRRIFPALLITTTITLFTAIFIFSPNHFEKLVTSSLYSVTGISNFYFWYHSGYFDIDKFFKPLLHTWSLSVELQLYLIWPILILVLKKVFKEKIIYAIIVVITISIIFSTILSKNNSGYFYFTLFRIYEFSLGSLVFFLEKKNYSKFNTVIFFISLLVLSLFFDSNTIYPSFNAFFPCIFACAIILNNNRKATSVPINYIIFISKISYSIYLIHWPLLVFYRYYKARDLFFYEKLFILFSVLILSIILNKFIEEPYRKKEIINKKKLLKFFILNFSIIIFFVLFSKLNINYNLFSQIDLEIVNKISADNKIKQEIEMTEEKKIKDNNYFNKNNKKINTLVMGDSHGFDIFLSLQNNNNLFTKNEFAYYNFDYLNCFKKKNQTELLIDVIKYEYFNMHSYCAKGLQTFNINILNNTDLLILSNRWDKNLDTKLMINFLRKNFKGKIILTGRAPKFFDVPTLYYISKNNLNENLFDNRDKITDLINQNIKSESAMSGVEFFDKLQLVCSYKKCEGIYENNLLYSDHDHWSYFGTKYFGKKLYEKNFLNSFD